MRTLAMEEIVLGQAIGILAEMAERRTDTEQQTHNPQAMNVLRQMQANEP